MRKYRLNIGEDGRVLSATFGKYGTPDMPEADDLPKGRISDYKYINGEFVHSPVEVAQVDTPATPTEILTSLLGENILTVNRDEAIEYARQFGRAVENYVDGLPDERGNTFNRIRKRTK